MTLRIDVDHDMGPYRGILSGGYFDKLTHELRGLNGLEATEDWLKQHNRTLTDISSDLLSRQPDTSTVQAIGVFLPQFSGCVGSVIIGQNELVNGEEMKIIANFVSVLEGDSNDTSGPVRQAVVDRFMNGLRSRDSTFFETNHFQSLGLLDFMITVCDTTPPIILQEDSIAVFTSMVGCFRKRIPINFGESRIKRNFNQEVLRQANLHYRGDTRLFLQALAASREQYERAYQSGMRAIDTLRMLTWRENKP